MSNLSSGHAVFVAREVLAEKDAGGTEEEPVLYNEAFWLGRVTEALRLVLQAIDDAEGGTP